MKIYPVFCPRFSRIYPVEAERGQAHYTEKASRRKTKKSPSDFSEGVIVGGGNWSTSFIMNYKH
ncbi:MAG: hypothetical protein IJU28_03200 [Clostridia bacterium]|nr:hypothetical protein [Clostridia bacterium]